MAEISASQPKPDNTQHWIVNKGETIPVQAWTGPEGYRTLWLPNFKTIGI